MKVEFVMFIPQIKFVAQTPYFCETLNFAVLVYTIILAVKTKEALIIRKSRAE